MKAAKAKLFGQVQFPRHTCDGRSGFGTGSRGVPMTDVDRRQSFAVPGNWPVAPVTANIAGHEKTSRVSEVTREV